LRSKVIDAPQCLTEEEAELPAGRTTQSILSLIHHTLIPQGQIFAEQSPRRRLTKIAVEEVVLKPSAAAIEQQASTVQQLAEVASKHPFYKYNGMWQRDIQNLVRSLPAACC
jgi:hypothetical protein